MMAGRFSKAQWDSIEAELAANTARYGMPEGPREESMLFASFNIRKLGSTRNRQRELAFMARFCARCDLVAIQEVQDDLEGLLRLKALVDERVSSAGEIEALIRWMTMRLKREKRMIAPNFVLLGDLNLDFDKPIKDRDEIEAYIKGLNKEVFGSDEASRIYFPFIDKHPLTGREIRTNARQNQTFDQIAFLRGAKEDRLPSHLERNAIDRCKPDGFDFGVFNFAELFARVIEGKAYYSLTKTERRELGKHFEHSVSDHMPIWVRLPRPGF